MKYSNLAVFSILAIIVVSGCIEAQQSDNYIGGESISEEKTQIPEGYCYRFKAMLKKARYYPDNQSLELTVYNYGRDNLDFSVVLYQNSTIEERPETYSIEAKKTEIFTIEDVLSDLGEVAIQLKTHPCFSTEDFLPRSDIEGLNE